MFYLDDISILDGKGESKTQNQHGSGSNLKKIRSHIRMLTYLHIRNFSNKAISPLLVFKRPFHPVSSVLFF